jgi:hypothetical protein
MKKKNQLFAIIVFLLAMSFIGGKSSAKVTTARSQANPGCHKY